MTISLRAVCYAALVALGCIAVFLVWLWRPERQVKRHTENLVRAIEHKNWTAAASFIGSDYRDQWGDDRARVLDRMREAFTYLRGVKLTAFNVSVHAQHRRAEWSGRIWVDCGPDEIGESVKQAVNSLPSPFQLEWQRFSRRPWDWSLVSVKNSALEIPAELYQPEG